MRESLLEHLVGRGADRRRESFTVEVFRSDGPEILDGVLTLPDGSWWWVAGGIPRILPPSMYRNPDFEQRYRGELSQLGLEPVVIGESSDRLDRVQRDTIDRFGVEWLMLRDWGHLLEPPAGREAEHHGGLWRNTLFAFETKTFLPGRLEGKLVLDAGCGKQLVSGDSLFEIC